MIAPKIIIKKLPNKFPSARKSAIKFGYFSGIDV
jgi:hypothetical protein